MNTCKICGNENGNKIHHAREIMFGFRDKFDYLECGQCGCVQLVNIPSDMARYYPPNYYSFQTQGWLMTQVRRRWSAYNRGGRSLIGWFVTELYFPNNAMKAVHRLGLPKNARILEIGSGSGRLLQDLCYFGFTDVSGVDPFIAKDLHYQNGPTIYKRQLAEMEGPYDLIMLNHSYEHMDHPAETMQIIAKLLAKDGRVIVRIPVASSWGWKHYGTNWAHIDAPRHFYLHTFKSMDILAAQAGLKVVETIHEAEEISITGSESFKMDIPLEDPRYPLSSSFKRLKAWRKRKPVKERIEQINRRKEADLICFYLAKAR
jgi:SAM-dependent methyltransferase